MSTLVHPTVVSPFPLDGPLTVPLPLPSPLPVPLIVPHVVNELQQRQKQCTMQQAWWPSLNPPASPIILGSRGAQPQDSHIQQEIEAAISEPLDNTSPDSHTTGHPVKTSSTHPIK
ncbi:hypothetical protein C0991_011033 [Blastosporella zonata]|nr:hypothetical protein C0991_011033 [Blastosporella zonata]